jgi:hypothetical protein
MKPLTTQNLTGLERPEMSNEGMRLTDFECPNCGANAMAASEELELVCEYCGTALGEVTRICPRCGHYGAPGDHHCTLCGARILRDCPACGVDNWMLARYCVECGRNLDLVERMAQRWQKTTQQRLYERQAAMISLKEGEERASQARMAELMEAERKRQEALAEARALQRQRDRQLYVLAGVSIVLVVVIIVMLLLLTPGGT